MNPTHHQTLRQLLTERVTLDIVFDKVDYAAGPFKKNQIWIRAKASCRQRICVCLYSFLFKAVHLEIVTTAAFIACLRHLISPRGQLSQIGSDNGTHFVSRVSSGTKDTPVILDCSSHCASPMH